MWNQTGYGQNLAAKSWVELGCYSVLTSVSRQQARLVGWAGTCSIVNATGHEVPFHCCGDWCSCKELPNSKRAGVKSFIRNLNLHKICHGQMN